MEKKNLIFLIVAALIIAGLFVFYGRDASILKTSEMSSEDTNNNVETGSGVCSGQSPVVKIATHPQLGDYLTDANCRTLYVYEKDTFQKSECNDECAKIWVPMLYDSIKLQEQKDPVSRNLNVITRQDGSLQYAWVDKALYYYTGDKKPGDVTGHQLGDDGMWSIKIYQ